MKGGWRHAWLARQESSNRIVNIGIGIFQKEGNIEMRDEGTRQPGYKGCDSRKAVQGKTLSGHQGYFFLTPRRDFSCFVLL